MISKNPFFDGTFVYESEGGIDMILEGEENCEEKVRQVIESGKKLHVLTNHHIFKVDFVKRKIRSQ